MILALQGIAYSNIVITWKMMVVYNGHHPQMCFFWPWVCPVLWDDVKFQLNGWLLRHFVIGFTR